MSSDHTGTISDPSQLETTHGNVRELTSSEKRKSLFAVVAGNFLEWFDWTVYAVLTPYLAAKFFDNSDPTSAVLATLGVFAGGFLARPLGGFVLGRIGDKLGRKVALFLSMIGMGVGSLIIAIMPTYETVGIWASIGLLTARIIQGFAHGGESGNAYTYLAEIAPAKRRGLWGSSIMFTVTLGVMAATALGALLSANLSEQAMADWGWRIPFFIGFLLAIFALFVRAHASESEFFKDVKAVTKADVRRPATRRQLTIIAVRIVMLSLLTQVLYYTWMSFFSSYAISSKGMDAKGAYLASLAAQVIALVAIPLWGSLSDKIGRKKLQAYWALAVMVIVFPISWVLTDEPWTLFVAQGGALIVWAMQASIHSTVMAEQAPTEVRATSVGVWASVGAALSGGTAPYLNTWLTANDLSWVFSLYIIILGVATLVTLKFTPNTTGVDMDKIPLPNDSRSGN